MSSRHLSFISGQPSYLAEKTASIHDTFLRDRAGHLPNLIAARWADSTTAKYRAQWEKWCSWCHKHPESPACPADRFYVALYINDLVLEKCAFSALEAAASGIRWGHIISGFDNPMDDILLQTILEGAKRTVGKPSSCQKEPLSADMAKLVVNRYGGGDLLQQRLVLTCLLGFSGFLRISELLAVQIHHLKFLTTHVEIHIPKAKNDQHREGHILHIARLDSPYCPVRCLEKYLTATNLRMHPDNFLISRLSKTKTGHNAHGRTPLSYSTVRDQFVKYIAPICEGQEPGSYGLHSLRSGGASAAADNNNSDRQIGKHGRWKSGFSRDRYIKDSKQRRLSLTNSLGL